MRNHKESSGNRQTIILSSSSSSSASSTSSCNSNSSASSTDSKIDKMDNNQQTADGKVSVVTKLLLKTSMSSVKDNSNGHTQRQRPASISPSSNISNNNNNNNNSGNNHSNVSFSSASVAGSIQDDPQHQQSQSQLDQCGLTQAGLEEYNIRSSSYYDPTVFHHQKQASYAQSEGYHSYVSSSDSTSATPFLDKLRQESDLLSRQSHHWSENDLSSVCSNSVAPSPIPLLLARQSNSQQAASVTSVTVSSNSNSTNSSTSTSSSSASSSSANNNNHSINSSNNNNNHNSSESTSSTETLKWLGSTSDISEASHATGYSAIAESVSSSQLIVHSSRVPTPKRHHSESVLTMPSPGAASTGGNSPIDPVPSGGSVSNQSLRIQHRHSPSYPPVHSTVALHHFQQQHLSTQSSLPELESPDKLRSPLLGQSQSTGDLQQQQQKQMPRPGGQQHKSSISVTISNSEAVVTVPPQPPASKPIKPQLCRSDALSCSAPNVGESVHSPTDSYRSNHRLFPVSTYTEPVHSNTSQYVQHPKPQYSSGLNKSNKLPVITPAGATVQPTWHSVAERINDFERTQLGEPAKFAYLEPTKTHRLSNPALKAFQKNAVQSYVERQQQQQQKEEQQLLRPQTHSTYQALQMERKSLPNNLSPITATSSNSSTCSSPTPPPPPPRSRSLLPNLLRRSSSASDYADFRDKQLPHQHHGMQVKPPPSIRNISSAEKLSFNDCGMPPPPPPPRGRVTMPTRRTSSATEYAPMRDKLMLQQAAALAHQQHHPQQHRHGHTHYPNHIQAPERPPKHPNLRVPSPELPPPPQSELDTSYTFDEPLPPPPPPEVLQPRTQLTSPVSPNRRNSFAGAASTRPSRTAVTTSISAHPKVPPLVPKKPSSLQHKHQLVNGTSASSASSSLPSLPSSCNLPTNNRKRPHQTPQILQLQQPIHESVGCTGAPPLLPRARQPTAHNDNVIASNLESNQQKRSNSKASYLPRQSLEKLNNTDPDHGIYKLTLTPNEDLVAHHHHHQHHHHHTKTGYGGSGVVGVGGKLTNNLPDVLPLGVKLQTQTKPPLQQPSSPNDGENISVSLRYGSNNNLATNTHSPTGVSTPYTMIYGQATTGTGMGQRYSSPALGQGYGKTTTPYIRSQSYDMMKQQQQATHHLTQSHSDLKQTAHDLETTLEEVIMPPPPTPTPPRLSPASSHSDCSSLELSSNAGEGSHIFRAELISTTLSHPQTKPPMNRQESLRENIEKITLLQSQLMSAHQCESGLTLANNYGNAKLASPSSKLPAAEKLTSSTITTTTTTPPPPPPPPHSNPPIEMSQPEAEIESLQLMQRSEIVLMVNPKPIITMDMACQTDDLFDRDSLDLLIEQEPQTRTTLQPRQRQPIELEYEKLSREFLTLLKPSDKLVEILTPKSCKPTHEYVNNLYNPDVPLRLAKRDVGTSTLMRMKSDSGDVTPEINGKMINIVELHLTDSSGEGTNSIKQKMEELLRRLNQKISSLKRERQTIEEESSMNDKLGQELFAQLAEKVRPSEASKFRTYVDDVRDITSLLLSLSERLGQTESCLEMRPQEKSILEAKRERLYEQLEEAQRLKTDIDRRGTTIASLLGKHLTADMCADYDYFINMKAKLIADARDLADRIKSSEEQLATLNDALVQSDC